MLTFFGTQEFLEHNLGNSSLLDTQRKARLLGKIWFLTSSMKGTCFKGRGGSLDNLIWPSKIIEKISLLPGWNRKHYYTLMYIRDLAKEASGLSPRGAVSSDVAWTSFSEQFCSNEFCHDFMPVSPGFGCSKCQ